MAKKIDFINSAKSQIGIGIYVWGANGELLSEIDKAWIRKKETSDKYADQACALYDKRKNVKGARAMDCSGTIVFSLRNCGAKSPTFDTTADGLRKSYCTEIAKGELQDGDLCFKMGWLDKAKTKWGAVHVGMYVGGKVIEAQGRKQGVVSRSPIMVNWTKYGRLKIKWEDEPKKYVLTRVLKKGCYGTDVQKLQQRLMKLGYDLGDKKDDGDFGIMTRAAVIAFQRNSGIHVDGKVGKETAAVLGWDFQKK